MAKLSNHASLILETKECYIIIDQGMMVLSAQTVNAVLSSVHNTLHKPPHSEHTSQECMLHPPLYQPTPHQQNTPTTLHNLGPVLWQLKRNITSLNTLIICHARHSKVHILVLHCCLGLQCWQPMLSSLFSCLPLNVVQNRNLCLWWVSFNFIYILKAKMRWIFCSCFSWSMLEIN